MSQGTVDQLAQDLANRPLVAVTIETSLLLLIALTAFVGNLSVLYVLYKVPRLRSVTSYYLVTLSLSDVFAATLVMPIAATNSALGRDVFGDAACQIIGFIGYTLVFGSLQTTTLIAVNRFFCVVKPILYRKYFKSKPTILMIVGAWTFSIANVGVVVASGMARFKFFPGRYCCMLSFPNSLSEKLFTAFAQLMFSVFPTTIVGLCYWKVFKVVKIHNENVSSTLNQGPGNRSLPRDETQITKSVLALVCGFVVCWFPCATVSQISAYMFVPRGVEMLFIFPAFLSSAVNPIVFNVFNKPFRQEFLRVFRLDRKEVRVVTVNPMSSVGHTGSITNESTQQTVLR
ncbi:predicted protein [Nematostella vectensis]|uniref:G-protein coupled receptors family 1 profile domain-containing protein n=1 Tax=Nematostella vectensis TaxID=45351 RepID=A7T5D9_NEMVE|nr:predicted protein [Nematostella vectensis]|eukprot:XP_001620925.1 hypothetical protein NEMVEDRAFT_v1g222560 [Nematostella vectensis]